MIGLGLFQRGQKGRCRKNVGAVAVSVRALRLVLLLRCHGGRGLFLGSRFFIFPRQVPVSDKWIVIRLFVESFTCGGTFFFRFFAFFFLNALFLFSAPFFLFLFFAYSAFFLFFLALRFFAGQLGFFKKRVSLVIFRSSGFGIAGVEFIGFSDCPPENQSGEFKKFSEADFP